MHEWLLIFDNADSEPDVVTKFMPPGNRGLERASGDKLEQKEV